MEVLVTLGIFCYVDSVQVVPRGNKNYHIMVVMAIKLANEIVFVLSLRIIKINEQGTELEEVEESFLYLSFSLRSKSPETYDFFNLQNLNVV